MGKPLGSVNCIDAPILAALGELNESERAYHASSAFLDTEAEYVETLARVGMPVAQKPRPELKQRLMSGIRAQREPAVQVWRKWAQTTTAEIHKVAAGEGEWEELEVHGVRVKRLWADPAQDSTALLIQMDPGTEYPSHRHAGPEHCYVISGDLQVGELELRTGDYQVANTGSTHHVTRSRGGCTILIVSSLLDELV